MPTDKQGVLYCVIFMTWSGIKPRTSWSRGKHSTPRLLQCSSTQSNTLLICNRTSQWGSAGATLYLHEGHVGVFDLANLPHRGAKYPGQGEDGQNPTKTVRPARVTVFAERDGLVLDNVEHEHKLEEREYHQARWKLKYEMMLGLKKGLEIM